MVARLAELLVDRMAVRWASKLEFELADKKVARKVVRWVAHLVVWMVG